MKSKRRISVTQRYQSALRQYTRNGGRASLEKAKVLGNQALKAGMHTLRLAKIHEQTLLKDLLPSCPAAKRDELIRDAALFFAAANMPIESGDPKAKDVSSRMEKVIEALSQRTVELAASNEKCLKEVQQRKIAEKAYIEKEAHYSELLTQSERLQSQLRQLSRQILIAQEEERKRISRELHDVIAQSLSGVNLRLAILKKEAGIYSKSIAENIDSSQQLLEESMNIIHQFARDLRPAVLDDLGLVPALNSCLKSFTERTRVKSKLVHNPGVDLLDASSRTVLFRVAQEALNNVARHSNASIVKITITKSPHSITMQIHDNGQSFQVHKILKSPNGNRLGLVGMRERVEMVHGNFEIESSPGLGTTVCAQIPLPEPTLSAKAT